MTPPLFSFYSTFKWVNLKGMSHSPLQPHFKAGFNSRKRTLDSRTRVRKVHKPPVLVQVDLSMLVRLSGQVISWGRGAGGEEELPGSALLLTIRVTVKDIFWLLVQRSNGTTAGLGHLEVGWNVHAQRPPKAVNLWPHFHAVGYVQPEW
jgi:hypothetical protein